MNDQQCKVFIVYEYPALLVSLLCIHTYTHSSVARFLVWGGGEPPNIPTATEKKNKYIGLHEIYIIMKTSEIYRHIFSGLKINLHTVPLFLLTYGMGGGYVLTISGQNTNIENIYEYASERGASELGKLLHFHILKLLFPSIFCWYF